MLVPCWVEAVSADLIVKTRSNYYYGVAIIIIHEFLPRLETVLIPVMECVVAVVGVAVGVAPVRMLMALPRMERTSSRDTGPSENTSSS